jgi:bifunctional non-homologous end joining protein LigD
MVASAPAPEDVRVTHADKLMFEEAGLTKGDLIAYYAWVGDVMLPHVKGRPVSMQVFHGGVGAPGHFMKQAPDYFPRWVRRVTVPKKGGSVTHVVANDADTLRLLANHNAVTLHVPTSRRDRLERPDRLIVDMDPPDDRRWPEVVAGARLVAEVVRAVGLEPFAMATGSRGLHVVAPLRREADYPEVFALSKAIAAHAVAASPDRLTMEFMKAERDERVFVDVLRNRWAQTAVAPYAVRAKPDAPVAVPLEWKDVEAVGPHPFTIPTFPYDRPDPWADIAAAAASPRSAARRAAKL